MSKGKIAGKMPTVIELEPGEYYWCRCGRSGNQPWCDGSHQGSEFEPIKVEISEKKRYAMCVCKQTNGAPFCDGTHSKLD